MDELHSLHPHGLFLRREAIHLGYRDRHLERALACGQLRKVRHGAYVDAARWEAESTIGRYRLLCQAVLLTHGNRVALSHLSAAVFHGLRTLEPDLRKVHVVRLDDRGGRTHRDVIYHEDPWTLDSIINLEEMLLLDPVSAAVGAASLMTVEAGVCLMDSLYDLDLGTPDQLVAAYRRRAHWPHSRKLQVVVRLARIGSQSVGESRTRFLFFVQGLPQPELQYRVYDDWGNLIGICDFAWPEHRLLGEFDGKIKYGRLLKPGETASDVVFREKQREDALRETTGFGMIRYVYSDLARPQHTAARTRRKLVSPFAA